MPATNPTAAPMPAAIICQRISLSVAYRITSGICTIAWIWLP
jgi:hypothetical protein